MGKLTKVITVSCGMELYNKITQLAKEGHRSRTQQIVLMLEEWLEASEDV